MIPAATIRQLASEAGFDLCGFARAEPIPSTHLTEWLEAGLGADMDWMSEKLAERLDVRRVLPGARTVVALACNYHFPDPPTEGSPIARYARGRDYHYTLQDRLRALRRTLKALHPEVQTYGEVDAGPVMEKVWAARAGLGYVGKNGCLITERFGSWVLLAAFVIDAEVDAYFEGEVADRCGTCRRCLVGCPTGAILPGRRVDARACLSYQTIENRAEIPEPLRPALAGRVFGCDICQEVCPLNRHPVATRSARFAPRAVAGVGARELAALTPERYQELVAGTPLGRAKYDGLRRNAIYALGAVKDAGAAGLLAKLCDDPSEPVRGAARWALGQLSA